MNLINFLITIFILYMMIITTQQSLIDWDGNSICPKSVSHQVSKLVPYTEKYKKFWRYRTRTNYRWEYHTEWISEDACCSGYKEQSGECWPVCNGGNGCPHGLCIRPNQCNCDVGYKLVTNNQEQTCIPECSNCLNGECIGPNVCKCNDGYEKSLTGTGECLPSCKPRCPYLSTCHEGNKCICMSGYILANVTVKLLPDSSDYHCKPVCSPECDENSICLSPGFCLCNAGYEKKYINGIKSSNECVPSCETPCGDHSTCTKPDTCECNTGYAPLNNQNNDQVGSTNISPNCVPVCLPSCGEFGRCQSPNSCVCNDGYNLLLDRDNKTSEITTVTCEPQCNPSCGIRGDCIAPPSKCSCEIGWKIIKTIDENSKDISYCEPHCESCPKFSVCIKPNECECQRGYEKIIDHLNVSSCRPVCDKPCINGICEAPNVCKCNDGYEKSITGECRPSCNPRCPFSATCHEGNKCICMYRYILANVTTKSLFNNSSNYYCKPVCSPECDENSICLKPGICLCNAGYEKKYINGIKASNKCMPSCETSCGDHSTCTKPNVCECNPGYVPLSNQNTSTNISPVCVPVCLPSCGEFGRCQSPNSCVCDEGYNLILGRDNKTSKITTVKCEPQCNPSCGIRGNCIAPPNKCSCKIGWKIKKTIDKNLKDISYCEPHCESCPKFSVCIKPNECECHHGYEKIIDDLNIKSCRPICDKTCINGICDTPNICKCNDGYILDTSDPFNCEPNCGFSGCFGGHCTAPHVCTCYDNYRPSKNQYICDPICNKCDNGTCIAPEVCLCNEGFIKNSTDHCIPSCDNKCFNGTCIAPFTCECDSGFTLSNSTNSSSMCEPFCQSGCPNATCTGPDECLCLDGFVRNDNGDCIPECYELCKFNNLTVGNCTGPSQCTCYSGYEFINTTEGEQCQPSCKNSCINGQCILPDICKCNDGYIKDNFNTSICNPVCDIDCGYGDCLGPNQCVCHDGFIQINNTNDKNQTGPCLHPCKHDCGYGKCNTVNQTCECDYGWISEYCNTTKLCGLIRTENDIDYHKWFADKNKMNDTVGYLEAVKWQGPMCNEMCYSDYVNNTNKCFRLSTDEEQFNNTTSIICFINNAATCNLKQVSINNESSSGITVGIVIFIIGIISMIGAIHWITKRRKIQNYKCHSQIVSADSSSRGNLLKQSEFTDSLLQSDENSYL